MWDLPGPGLEYVSPALAGGFSTTAPLGKPLLFYLKEILELQLAGQGKDEPPCQMSQHLLFGMSSVVRVTEHSRESRPTSPGSCEISSTHSDICYLVPTSPASGVARIAFHEFQNLVVKEHQI